MVHIQEWLSGAQLARRMNCSRAAVCYAYKAGLIERRFDKKYPWPLAQEQYLERVDVGQQRPFRMSWR